VVEEKKELLNQIWEYIQEKDIVTYRIFLLHYVCGLTFKECVEFIPYNYSIIIHKVYRTIEELKQVFK